MGSAFGRGLGSFHGGRDLASSALRRGGVSRSPDAPRRRPGRLPLLLAPAVLLVTAWGDVAAARHYVGVLNIRGPGAKRVRRFLEQQIDERWVLVSRRDLADAAEDLEISSKHMTRRRNLRRICRKAKADAVITGYVYRARRRWWLAIQVRDGGTGRIVKRTVVRYLFFRLNRWSRRAIMKAVRIGVRRAEGVDHPPRRVAPPPRPRPKTPHRSSSRTRRAEYLTGLEVDVGVEIWGRRLSFTNLDGEPGKRLLYETTRPVLPLSFGVEVYPGAFVTGHRILANVGLGLYFRRAVGVVSQREGDPTKIRTTIQRVGGHLLYRWNINGSAESTVLKIGAGVDALQYSFAEDLGQVAGVTYISFRVLVKALVPLATERLKLCVWLAGMAVAQLGQMADAYHYGNGRAGGIEAGLGLDVRLAWKIHLLAGASTTWVFVKFPQDGVQGLDFEYVVDSAKDGYFGGYLLVAMHY